MKYSVAAILLLLIAGSVVQSLKLTSVVVPPYKLAGESATLLCPFDLERDRLYAVKWYKDNEEFFRFVPKYLPPMSQHPVDGIQVKITESHATQVTLTNLDMRSTGVYRCEVSAERPSFASVQGEGRMTVVHLPAEAPQISGPPYEEYEVGDVLELNCTSAPSFPPARLSWYINDALVPTAHVRSLSKSHHHHQQQSQQHLSVSNSTSQLVVKLEGHHLEGGEAKVRCVASIFANVWQDGDERIVSRDRGNEVLRSSSNLPLVDDRDALYYVKSGAGGPLAVGGKFNFWSVVVSTAVLNLLVTFWVFPLR